MKIIQKVLIKQIITEKSKEKLKSKFQKQKMQLEQECQQLIFEQKKLQKKLNISKQEILKKFQYEIKQREEQIKITDFKIKQLEMLKVGSEIIESEVEALVEVKVGDHWDDFRKTKSIIIKDGIVVRIDK